MAKIIEMAFCIHALILTDLYMILNVVSGDGFHSFYVASLISTYEMHGQIINRTIDTSIVSLCTRVCVYIM